MPLVVDRSGLDLQSSICCFPVGVEGLQCSRQNKIRHPTSLGNTQHCTNGLRHRSRSGRNKHRCATKAQQFGFNLDIWRWWSALRIVSSLVSYIFGRYSCCNCTLSGRFSRRLIHPTHAPWVGGCWSEGVSSGSVVHARAWHCSRAVYDAWPARGRVRSLRTTRQLGGL